MIHQISFKYQPHLRLFFIAIDAVIKIYNCWLTKVMKPIFLFSERYPPTTIDRYLKKYFYLNLFDNIMFTVLKNTGNERRATCSRDWFIELRRGAKCSKKYNRKQICCFKVGMSLEPHFSCNNAEKEASSMIPVFHLKL